MKALVTGATGFIGSHLADLLHQNGFEVRCTIRKTSNLRWLENKPYELIEASLFDTEALAKAVKGVDYIFHVAGLTAAKNLDEFMKGNCEGTKNLLDVAINNAPKIKRFLYVSSQTAVGPSLSFEMIADENTVCNPITSYGKSKRMAEDEVMKSKGKIPVTIIRPPAVYGPRDTEIFSIFKAVNMGIGTLIGFKKKYVSLIHSDDLVRGIYDAAISPMTKSKIYFVSSELFYSWDYLMQVMKKAMGKKRLIVLKLPHSLVLSVAFMSGLFGKFSKKPPVFNYEKGKDFIQSYWTCSISRAKSDFGFKPKVSLEQGMRETIEWYRKNNWLK